jgi:hypothetical protein
MSTKQALRQAILDVAMTGVAGSVVSVFAGEVESVDEGSRTCAVRSLSLATDTPFPAVQFMPSVSDGVMFVPAVGSYVLVADPKNLSPYVIMWSEVDKVQFVVNNTILTIKDGLTTFNEGDNAGLVKVIPLTTKLNAIEQDINLLKTTWAGILAAIAAAASGSPTGSVTNLALQGFLSSFLPYTAAPLAITTQVSIEDKKVVH